MPFLNTRELKDKFKNERGAFVEEAVEAGMPFSAYADSEYDPEKDGELGADDARLTAMEVICDELDMTTMCNPAAGMYGRLAVRLSLRIQRKCLRSKRCR